MLFPKSSFSSFLELVTFSIKVKQKCLDYSTATVVNEKEVALISKNEFGAPKGCLNL